MREVFVVSPSHPVKVLPVKEGRVCSVSERREKQGVEEWEGAFHGW